MTWPFPPKSPYAKTHMGNRPKQLYTRRGKRFTPLEPGTDPWLWSLLCDEVPRDLLEENPFVDNIIQDPVHLLAQMFGFGEGEEEVPATRKSSWEEKQQAKRAWASKYYRHKILMAKVAKALAVDGFSLRGFV